MVLRFPQHPLQHQQWLQSLNLNSIWCQAGTKCQKNTESSIWRVWILVHGLTIWRVNPGFSQNSKREVTRNDTTAGSNSELCLFLTKWPWIKALVSISPPRDVFTILAKRSGATSLARQSSLRFHSSIAPKKRYLHKQKQKEGWLVEYICFNKGPYSINRHTLDPFCFLTLSFHNFPSISFNFFLAKGGNLIVVTPLVSCWPPCFMMPFFIIASFSKLIICLVDGNRGACNEM